MAQLPPALSCQRATWSWTRCPCACTTKSTMVVVPPQAAARVPVSNVSEAWVPPKGLSMCVWPSMPPGMTYFPLASITVSALIGPSALLPGARTAAIASPSTTPSATTEPVAETTAPPLINVVIGPLLPSSSTTPHSRRSAMSAALRLDGARVGVRAAVAVELPVVAGPGDLVEVEVADEDLLLVLRRALADEVPPRVDEVGRPVEGHGVLPELLVLPADPVVGGDEVLVVGGGGRLLDVPEPVRQTGLGGRGVEDDLRVVQAELAPALREVPVVADVDADPADRGVEHRVAQVARAEVELLPELRQVRDVVLAVLAEQ